MTPEAVLQPLLDGAVAFGWNWLWLLALIPIFVALELLSGTRRATKMRERTAQARRDKLAKLQSRRRTRVIAIVHREEMMPGIGFPIRGFIRQDDAEHVLAAIRATPPTKPLDIILHTPGGLVLHALQIARAIKAHPARKTVFVPHLAMSGGTLIALAADEIVMSDHAVLGPIDPQIGGAPAASWVKVAREKPIAAVQDETLLLADMSQKVLDQMRKQACELMQGNYTHDGSCAVSDLLASGKWTHDYPITVPEAKELGLHISTDMPADVIDLTTLLAATTVRQPSVHYTPGKV
ncbi:MAG: ATP-dependent Clp protease proteolytic subunit [Alphaproteobacteria bacterium]|nr:ATP-dependent Clp protease proteolytic subunit [Alphaproteobacteria bacterium]